MGLNHKQIILSYKLGLTPQTGCSAAETHFPWFRSLKDPKQRIRKNKANKISEQEGDMGCSETEGKLREALMLL